MSPLALLLFMAASPCFAKRTCGGSPDLDVNERIEPDASGAVVIEGIATFPNGSWYLSEQNTTRLCVCDLFLCLRKCCREPWQSVDLATFRCTNITDPSLPPFEPQFYNRSSLLQRESVASYRSISTKDAITQPVFFNSDDFEYFLLDDGTLLFRGRCGKTPLRPETFCIDRVEDNDETVVIADKGDLPEACGLSFLQSVMYPLSMMASLPFLAATFLAYALVPKLRNLHGRSLMCHVSSLFVAFLVFGVQNICRTNCKAICVPSALITYMGFLSAFFWLNVMSYDIWSTFREIKPRKLTPQEENRRFYMFAAYSWGCPLLIVILTSLLQLYAKDLPRSIIKPYIGVKRCWFFGKRQKAVYLFLPLTLIVISNMYFFGYVIYKIRLLRKDSEILRNKEDKNDHETLIFRFVQYIKLFITMVFTIGLSWIFEAIETLTRYPSTFFDIGNFVSFLQGLLIFIIFVTDRRTRKIIMDYVRSKGKESKTSNTKL